MNKDFISQELLDSYDPQALCISDSADVKIQANWFSSAFKSLSIGISYCKPTADKTCATKDAIDEWLLKHPAFFVH